MGILKRKTVLRITNGDSELYVEGSEDFAGSIYVDIRDAIMKSKSSKPFGFSTKQSSPDGGASSGDRDG